MTLYHFSCSDNIGETGNEDSARLWSATAEIHGHDGSPGNISLD